MCQRTSFQPQLLCHPADPAGFRVFWLVIPSYLKPSRMCQLCLKSHCLMRRSAPPTRVCSRLFRQPCIKFTSSLHVLQFQAGSPFLDCKIDTDLRRCIQIPRVGRLQCIAVSLTCRLVQLTNQHAGIQTVA